MSGSTYPTLSTTIPLYNILIDHLEDIIEDDEINDDNESGSTTETESNTSENENDKNGKWSQLIKEASKKCRKKLLEYYNKTNDSYLMSIILDPRLKLQYYHDHEWGEQLIRAPHGLGQIRVTRQVDPKHSGRVIKFMTQYRVGL